MSRIMSLKLLKPIVIQFRSYLRDTARKNLRKAVDKLLDMYVLGIFLIALPCETVHLILQLVETNVVCARVARNLIPRRVVIGIGYTEYFSPSRS